MSNQVYNAYMTRNHFSKEGGPYFINNGFSKHPTQAEPVKTKGIPIIGRVTALLKFPPRKQQPFFWPNPSCIPPHKEE